ncbi:hypothetical protein H5410_017492 [Solanum commersonii]|uniref:Uncharacterized protein n=1 Tax=Solanum commersonii TaxID=4109 RepID=A0A9J6A0I2_SOLCO|nr:hypothetical protein H5410_017492 [Solanum commersonii]
MDILLYQQKRYLVLVIIFQCTYSLHKGVLEKETLSLFSASITFIAKLKCLMKCTNLFENKVMENSNGCNTSDAGEQDN